MLNTKSFNMLAVLAFPFTSKRVNLACAFYSNSWFFKFILFSFSLKLLWKITEIVYLASKHKTSYLHYQSLLCHLFFHIYSFLPQLLSVQQMHHSVFWHLFLPWLKLLLICLSRYQIDYWNQANLHVRFAPNTLVVVRPTKENN